MSHICEPKKGKAKRTWFSPSSNYYQTTVTKVLHRFPVTRSNNYVKEESPYKVVLSSFYVFG